MTFKICDSGVDVWWHKASPNQHDVKKLRKSSTACCVDPFCIPTASNSTLSTQPRVELGDSPFIKGKQPTDQWKYLSVLSHRALLNHGDQGIFHPFTPVKPAALLQIRSDEIWLSVSQTLQLCSCDFLTLSLTLLFYIWVSFLGVICEEPLFNWYLTMLVYSS